MAYRQLPPDVHQRRQGIIKEAEGIKSRMAAAKSAGEDTTAHESALQGLADRHERLLAPYKIAAPNAQETLASGGTPKAGAPKRVNLDTARDDADEVERAHRAAGGKAVKALNTEEIKAADRDKSWHGKSAEEQQAAAKSARLADEAPAGAAHTSSTPGSTHQTAMAAALAKAGVSAPAEKPAPAAPSKPAAKKTSVTPDAAMSARNNMAVPRSNNDTSVVSGVTAGGSQEERDRARAAATKGARGTGGKAAEESAARASTRRSAASSVPVRGQQFDRVGGNGAEASSAPGRDWVTPSQISPSKPAPAVATPAPVQNPAPHAPAPAMNATPAAPSAPTTQPSGPREPLARDNIIGAKPQRGVSPAHMVSSAPDRHWLRPQAVNKAKAGKAAPRAAVSEEPTLAAPAKKENVGGGRKAPSSAAAVGNVNRSAMPSDNGYQGVVSSIGSQPQRTPMAAPQTERAHAAEASGFNAPQSAPAGRTRTPTTGPSGPVGAGRSGVHQGGERNVQIGGDNHGHVTQNHNTYNINYGSVGGSQGNVDHGYSPRGPQNRGGGATGGGGGHDEGHGHGGGFNAWYKDSTGHHDLRKGLDHVTGRTGGNGERLDKESVGSQKNTGTVGGSQRPMKGSPRAAGNSTPSQPQSTTGTTHNWQGPQHQAPVSASGNGTAQHTTTP